MCALSFLYEKFGSAAESRGLRISLTMASRSAFSRRCHARHSKTYADVRNGSKADVSLVAELLSSPSSLLGFARPYSSNRSSLGLRSTPFLRPYLKRHVVQSWSRADGLSPSFG